MTTLQKDVNGTMVPMTDAEAAAIQAEWDAQKLLQQQAPAPSPAPMPAPQG